LEVILKERINELYKIIEKSNKEIEKIRKNCKHDKGYTVNLYSWRLGSLNPERICNTCGGLLPGVTKEEAIECEIENTTFYNEDDQKQFEKDVKLRYNN